MKHSLLETGKAQSEIGSEKSQGHAGPTVSSQEACVEVGTWEG